MARPLFLTGYKHYDCKTRFHYPRELPVSGSAYYCQRDERFVAFLASGSFSNRLAAGKPERTGLAGLFIVCSSGLSDKNSGGAL